MKILIVDDESLARERIREMLKTEAGIESIFEAAGGNEAVELAMRYLPDLIFLDIQMPEMNGFEVLKTLGEKLSTPLPIIIFVTAYDQYALEAFKFHALDYLLKSFDRERFRETFNLCRERIGRKNLDGYGERLFGLLEKMNQTSLEYLEWITVKKDERILLFPVEDINWIEAQGNYARLKFGDSSQMLRETINHLETQLDPRIFVRIHRSTIVNINQIKELQIWARGEYRVIMKNGKTLTLSRSYRSKFDSFLKKGAL